ncbi:hypothetical protein BH24ACT26_BH24ACT26_06650 [soil metagenome]
MDDDRGDRGDEERGRARPRVVDKRVSARTDSEGEQPRPGHPSAQEAAIPSAAAAPAAPPQAAAVPAPEQAAPVGPGPEVNLEGEGLWTPEQEAEARAFAQQITDTPSRDWVLNTAVTLANVAATKLDAGMGSDAQLAIDALAGLVNAVGTRLGDAEAPLRQTVAQLQLGYAQSVAPPPPG